ncbi:hypothetical protein [Planobispora rosea]|nr:hypothetical protein [Planobispora rosea]
MTATTLKKTRIRPSKYCHSVRITMGQARKEPDPTGEAVPERRACGIG